MSVLSFFLSSSQLESRFCFLCFQLRKAVVICLSGFKNYPDMRESLEEEIRALKGTVRFDFEFYRALWISEFNRGVVLEVKSITMSRTSFVPSVCEQRKQLLVYCPKNGWCLRNGSTLQRHADPGSQSCSSTASDSLPVSMCVFYLTSFLCPLIPSLPYQTSSDLSSDLSWPLLWPLLRPCRLTFFCGTPRACGFCCTLLFISPISSLTWRSAKTWLKAWWFPTRMSLFSRWLSMKRRRWLKPIWFYVPLHLRYTHALQRFQS